MRGANVLFFFHILAPNPLNSEPQTPNALVLFVIHGLEKKHSVSWSTNSWIYLCLQYENPNLCNINISVQ